MRSLALDDLLDFPELPGNQPPRDCLYSTVDLLLGVFAGEKEAQAGFAMGNGRGKHGADIDAVVIKVNAQLHGWPIVTDHDRDHWAWSHTVAYGEPRVASHLSEQVRVSLDRTHPPRLLL